MTTENRTFTDNSSSDRNIPEWMKDDLVKNIPREKLELLQQMFADADTRVKNAGTGRSQKEMLMTLMPVLQKAKAANLSFSPKEIQAAVTAIRKYSTPEELKQIDKIYAATGRGRS